MSDEKKVLIVDDEPDAIEIVESILSDIGGITTFSASDGNSGLEKAKEIKPDLIILDGQMPGKSGFDMFDDLNRREDTKDIPVIMLTSVNAVTDSCYNAGHLKEYLDCEPAAFLEKPIEPDRLLAEVIRILEPGTVDEDTTPTA